MSRRVVINQSNYLPWKGYFDLIHDADIFVFLDDVQFTKNDWRNRNRIKGPNGTHWLTIPVGGSVDRRIDQVLLPAGPWRARHWKSLVESYAKAPFFDAYASFFREVFTGAQSWLTLSEMNQHLIRMIARDFLGITTEFVDSREFNLTSRKEDRVLDILKCLGATTYLSGPAGRAYLDPGRFAREGIEVAWKDYSRYPVYPQVHPPFEHAVSIVDTLFCAGPKAPSCIWGSAPESA